MGRYERMICYLYEYQDGHKGANVGYVKLEKRGEKCRVLIQMRRADLATLPQAALFQQEKTGVLLIPIGVMRDNNGSMKGQYEGNVDNLAGTGLSLDDVHGVLVYVEEGHYFASTWNLEQIRVAAGEKLSYEQSDIHITGHAIECRINAENPDRGFAPCPGLVDYLMLPSGGLGIRVDTAIYEGYEIPPFYDSMIAKVIAHGRDREEAIAKMNRALYEFIINGIDTNIEFQSRILNNPDYLAGQFDTSFLEDNLLQQ